ncbi:MAG TPA: YraN family protein [Fibrobacteria bacterium]|nr:YraN family protein [Fibrobacteria bacterium]HOX52779.1 YraN family protein [Fibrobacteria bacterium]
MSSPTPDHRRLTGAQGEALAAEHLEGKGIRILHRNWKHGRGELDLVGVALDSTVVFVEVKTSRGHWAGDPAEWITPQKQLRLGKLALAWLVRHQATGRKVRFDAVLVRQGVVEHIEDAFWPPMAGF